MTICSEIISTFSWRTLCTLCTAAGVEWSGEAAVVRSFTTGSCVSRAASEGGVYSPNQCKATLERRRAGRSARHCLHFLKKTTNTFFSLVLQLKQKPKWSVDRTQEPETLEVTSPELRCPAFSVQSSG